MDWIKKLKISEKLYVLIAMATIFVAIVGLVGFCFNTKAAADISAMYKDRTLPIVWLGNIRTNIKTIRGDIYTMTTTNNMNEKKALFDEIVALKANNNENLSKYEATKLDPFEEEDREIENTGFRKCRCER